MFLFRTKHFSDFLEYILDLLPLYFMSDPPIFWILFYRSPIIPFSSMDMLRNAPNILYLVLWSFKIYQSVCSSEDKYPSFIKKIYFSFSGFYTRKWIRLLRYDFSLSCKITCSKGIVRDRHYTSCITRIAIKRAIKEAIFHFPYANV